MLNLIRRIKRQLQASLAIKPSPLQQGPKHPYIFVHINKTGGTSVGNAIGLSVKHHQTVTEIIRRIGQQQWESSYKFTFVRNPWDRMVSLYEYRHKKNKTKIASLGIGFEEWVAKTIGSKQSKSFYDNPKSFQSQADWLKDQQGIIAIDFVGRFESINEDFDKISQAIGLTTTLPHLNASQRGRYQDYYTDQSRESVANWFHEDIEQFNYRFEPA